MTAARGPLTVLGIGFPRSIEIPTRVTACGDGVHTAVATAAAPVDCVCDRLTIDVTEYRRLPFPVRVVLADASMETAPVGETRRITGRLAP